ncbi:MAG: Mu transposase C-terminal domain-containing protein [Candidatus Babeliales bacterium]
MSIQTANTLKEVSEMTGLHITTLSRLVKQQNIPYRLVKGKGGEHIEVNLQDWPSNIQERILLYIEGKEGENTPAAIAQTMVMLPALKPALALKAIKSIGFDEFPENSLVETARPRTREEMIKYYDQAGPEFAVMMKPRVQKIVRIIEKAMAPPRGWGKRAWIEAVAEENKIAWQSLYRYIKRYEEKGIVGLAHTKSYQNQSRKWTPEAVDHWFGLCFKRDHRKIDRKYLYKILVVEAQKRGWTIGGEGSAYQKYRSYKKRYLLEAYQRGGMHALDNALPPILRNYSDLAPFECLVGDQHRKNRWVVDDLTGDVIRIEAYVWQDLRTRVIYGGACARHYSAYLMGLALRMGLRTFGTFSTVYTDNGQPEKSLYFNGILSNIRSYDMDWRQTINIPTNTLDVDAEEVYPATEDPQLHRLAIVQNAKAKMIEGTWRVLENIMTSVMLLPGDTKRLGDDIHHQDIDQEELKRLRDAGKLPLMSQYIIAFYRSIDYYNKEKPHRGVRKEWRRNFLPASGGFTPFDCLRACYEADGWRPKCLSDRAIDLLFMMEETRIVNRGHIQAFNDTYVHDALLDLHGEQIQIRYDLVDYENLLVFHQGQYIGTATPIEYSSMKDQDLTRRKIMAKRSKAKEIYELYARLTRPIEDMRTYGSQEQIEQVAALVEDAKERKKLERIEQKREITQAELEAHITKMEQGFPLPAKTPRPIPGRPDYFLTAEDHWGWIVSYLKAGGELGEEDEAFKIEHLGKMNQGQREYYGFVMNEYQGG